MYSALPLAKQELPDLEINHRSAVSLARRVLDPLAELCKIPPESLSVGMYQVWPIALFALFSSVGLKERYVVRRSYVHGL